MLLHWQGNLSSWRRWVMFQTLLRSSTLGEGAHYGAALKLWLSDMWSCVVSSCHIFGCVVRDVAILWYVVTCGAVSSLIHKATFNDFPF